MPEGQNIEFFLAGGGWPQADEARRNLAGLTGSITVDGVALVTGFRTHEWSESDFGVKIAGVWTATSGTHQVDASMTLFGGASASCSIVVP